MKLRKRFALNFSLAAVFGAFLTLVAATGISLNAVRGLSEDFRSEVDFAMFTQSVDGAKALIGAFEAGIREPMRSGDSGRIDSIARAVLSAPNVVTVAVFDGGGKAIHDGKQMVSGQPDPAPKQVARKMDPGSIARWNDGETMVFATPVCVDGTCIGTVLVGMAGGVLKSAISSLEGQIETSERDFVDRLLTLGALALAATAVFAAALGFFLAGRVSTPIRALTGIFTRVAEGNHNIEIPSKERPDEIGDLARTLSSFLDISLAAARTQSALEGASAKFMITDAIGRIVSVNSAAADMFQRLEADIRVAIPSFDAGHLIGSEFGALVGEEAFREIEEQIDGRLASRDVDSGESEEDDQAVICRKRIKIDERTFDLAVTPVVNFAGERLGFAIEWRDMTQQLATEAEVAEIVAAAGQGDFSRRLDETGKDEFMFELARGINKLLATVENGLTQIVEVIAAFADGDLTKRMHGEYHGEFLRLREDSDRMVDRVAAIVRQIGDVTDAVQQAANNINSGVTDLSARSEQQAATMTQTTASMAELAQAVNRNSDSAREASDVAAAAREVAEKGGSLAQSAVSAMGEISGSSTRITDIVGLIQEIAFQTNLLALNASVEAARAGDAGKGFSVVANEVRALAQRAAGASREIQDLIVNSDNQIQQGVELVNSAGGALNEIVKSAKSVADHVSEIAAASHQQKSGIETVSGSIDGMDVITRKNVLLVEETNSALLAAQRQIGELQRAVGFFRLARAEDHTDPAFMRPTG